MAELRPRRAPAQRKRRPDIRVALRGRQAGLRRPVPRPAQDAPHRRPHMPRQVIGLIEAALPGAPWMKRYRHHGIGVPEQFLCRIDHQRRERRGQQSTVTVLERVQDEPERALVARRAPRDRDRRLTPPAPRAQRLRVSPRGPRLAATNTARRCDAHHAEPARRADGARQRPAERGVARRAGGLEHESHDRV